MSGAPRTAGLVKSVVLTSLLPEAMEDMGIFEAAVKRLSALGVQNFEFYTPFKNAGAYGRILRKNGCQGMYLASAYQKIYGRWLCDTDEAERLHAVEETMDCIRAAEDAGCRRLLITSGCRPQSGDIAAAARALERSLESLAAEMPEDMELYIEPGDTAVDGFQLIGSTADAVGLAERIRFVKSNFFLTMDTSHTTQLGEEVETMLLDSREYCRHVHIANCILKKGHPLYGDKHPFLSDPHGAFAKKELVKAAERAAKLHGGELILAVEIIGRDGWRNDLERFVSEEDWFFRFGAAGVGK